MDGLLEFFFNLLFNVWSAVDTIISPLLNIIGSVGTTLVNILSGVLAWLLDSVNVIIEVFTAIANFFGVG